MNDDKQQKQWYRYHKRSPTTHTYLTEKNFSITNTKSSSIFGEHLKCTHCKIC